MKTNLQIQFIQEGGHTVAYCPAFDITSVGKDKNEALANLKEHLGLYLEECVNDGTLTEDLIAHGWTLQGSEIIPPIMPEQASAPSSAQGLSGSRLQSP